MKKNNPLLKIPAVKKLWARKEAIKIDDAAHSLLFGVVMTPVDDKPSITFSAKALRFVGDAVGDDVIVWHQKYYKKLTDTMNEAYREYIALIEKAKKEKLESDGEKVEG